MEVIDKKVKDEMQIRIKRDHKRFNRKKSARKMKKNSKKNLISPMPKFESKLSEYRQQSARQSIFSDPEKMAKLTEKFYRDISVPYVEKGIDADHEDNINEDDQV